jgi:hypothetical protein
MESIRKDLKTKYEATTRAIFKRSNTKTLIENIKKASHTKPELDFNKIIFPALGKMRLKVCENQFEIPYEEWRK